uniref:Uncharacterized protein n=1 Tax=Pyxicephalus adspersus TaxID=30357 RepID=A0AAV2ZIC3_PYXAD|nr:TPA: hypothetical protein GDO54_004801 [Pyxicephalus adspersus]
MTALYQGCGPIGIPCGRRETPRSLSPTLKEDEDGLQKAHTTAVDGAMIVKQNTKQISVHDRSSLKDDRKALPVSAVDDCRTWDCSI